MIDEGEKTNLRIFRYRKDKTKEEKKILFKK